MEDHGNEPSSISEVWVRFQKAGWHNWPDAPERRAYLRDPHRHMFHYEVRVIISGLGDDRGLEFHDLLDYARKMAPEGDLGPQSCEMLARNLATVIQQWVDDDMGLGFRIVTVTVSEDGECGATITIG